MDCSLLDSSVCGIFPAALYWSSREEIPHAQGKRNPSKMVGVAKGIRGQFSSVQFSGSVISDSLRPHESQHARPPCPSPSPGVHSDSHPSSQWCHPAISSSVVPSPPAPNPSQHQSLFQWVNSSHEVAKILEFQLYNRSFQKIPGWSHSEWTGWISLQSKELLRVFSSSSIRKYQFFCAQPSLSTKVLLPSVFFLGVGWGGGVKNKKIVAPTSQSYWGAEMRHLLIQVTKCLSIHYAFNFYNFQESN